MYARADLKEKTTLNSESCFCPSENTKLKELGRKRKGIPIIGEKSKRLKASSRERRRRHVLNDALESLRSKVPCVHQRSSKLSKIEVLRLAIDYIAMLSSYVNYQTPPPPPPCYGEYAVGHADYPYYSANPYDRWTPQEYGYAMRPLHEGQFNYQEPRVPPEYYYQPNGFRI